MSRLLEEYNSQIKQDLKSKLGLKNIFEVPKVEKIIINITILELAVNEDLSSINPTKLLKRSPKIKEKISLYDKS